MITATLSGGQFDGDTIQIAADGSISPPHALEYFGTDGQGKACFHRYEMLHLFSFSTWPEEDVKETYTYTGCRRLSEPPVTLRGKL